MTFYRRHWLKLLKFAEERSENYYSEHLGIDYIEKNFNILEKDFDGKLKQNEVQNLRVIRMLGDFQLHRTVLRRYYKHKQILHNKDFIKIINDFKKYCGQKSYSKVTVDHYSKHSAKFLDYADSQGITSCSQINLAITNNYIKTLARVYIQNN
ncbi:hypothetical protein [Candidatus Uabimicrobium sp. HlEnr_7]|uniref:hypothetical protein n=1 Tax=Candidatus Uabimicrobium helgolandensis TaxID=3095367 RepID=UPI0035560079